MPQMFPISWVFMYVYVLISLVFLVVFISYVANVVVDMTVSDDLFCGTDWEW